MPVLGIWVDDETKSKFEAVARERSTTASRLAAPLISEFLSQAGRESAISQAASPPLSVLPGASVIQPKSLQVFVRLEPYYFAELGRLAAERRWYRGTYLRNLFRTHVDRCPVLCIDEINAVRQVARQLADMGRNVNQIVKQLNTSIEHAHLVKSLDFEVIRTLIEIETCAVKNLLRANVRGWGVQDARS
ncbi:MAG: plasmid mobilization relaxosome protein MobC [Janthinobacterium lividum]